MRTLRAAVTTTAMIWGVPCIATTESPPRLSYLGDAQCPNRDDFAQQLLSRTRTIDALVQTQIRVTVIANAGGYVGKLDLTDSQGNRLERQFSGPTCSEVTQAIALVAAVTIDGAAASAATTNQSSSAAVSAQKSDSRPTASTESHADFHSAPVMPSRPDSPSSTRSRWFNPFSLGAVGGLHSAIAPYVTPTWGLSFAYRPNGVWGSPKFKLAAVVGDSRSTTVAFDAANTGTAEFLWMAARTLACTIVLEGNRMRLGSCAVLELGALRGSGSSSSGQGSSTGWWIAPGAGLEWSAQFDPIALVLTAGIVRPIAREHFKFQPTLEVFRPPNLGLLAEIGVNWTFQ